MGTRCPVTKLSRLFPVIYSEKLEETKDFYCRLLGFQVEFDSDWFVNLAGGANGELEVGIQRYDHELIPEAFRAIAKGVSLAMEVEDIDAIYSKFQDREDMVAPIADEEYGQRHFTCVDPNGVLVDVGMPIEPSDAFKAEYLDNE